MIRENETFKSHYKKENKDISGLVTQCEDHMEKLRFLEMKEKIMEGFEEYARCKTDMQKAIQMDAIKNQLKVTVATMISENFKYKEVIASCDIM